MSRVRRALVYLILAFILGGHAVLIVAQKSLSPEYNPWPFAGYSMYANASVRHSFEAWEFRGTGIHNPEREFVIPAESLPRQVSLEEGMRWLEHRIEEDPEVRREMEKVLKGLAVMYERALAVGSVDGEPLQAIRVYRRTWKREETGEGVRWHEVKPEMVLDVRLSEPANANLNAQGYSSQERKD